MMGAGMKIDGIPGLGTPEVGGGDEVSKAETRQGADGDESIDGMECTPS
jgi:hypothetical protein